MIHAGNEKYKVKKDVHKGILAKNVNTRQVKRDILLSMKKLFMKVSCQNQHVF